MINSIEKDTLQKQKLTLKLIKVIVILQSISALLLLRVLLLKLHLL